MAQLPISLQLALEHALSEVDAKAQRDAVETCLQEASKALSSSQRSQHLKTMLTMARTGETPIRKRRLLNICLAALLDAPSLPHAPDSFVWVFALPFTVTFSAVNEPSVHGPLALHKDAAYDTLEALHVSKVFNPHGKLGLADGIFMREDVVSIGAASICGYFASTTNAGTRPLRASSFELRPDMPAYRSRTMVLLGSSRLPQHETELKSPEQSSPLAHLAQIMKWELKRHGLLIDDVQAHPPGALADLFFECSGIAGYELSRNIANARAYYGPDLSVGIRSYGHTGYVELYAQLSDDSPFILVPSFSYMETQEELYRTVQRHCQAEGLNFLGIARYKQAGLGARLH